MAGKGHVHTAVMANGQRAGPDNSGNVDNLLSMMWNEGARLSLCGPRYLLSNNTAAASSRHLLLLIVRAAFYGAYK